MTILLLLEPVLLSLIEQVRFGGSQVNNLWTAVSVLFLDRALLAVVGIRDTGSSTDDTSSLIRSVVAFIADPDQGTRTHVRVADDTLAVAFFAQAANGWKSKDGLVRIS